MAWKDLLTRPFIGTLALALEHFVWQGAAIALVLFAVVRLARPGAHARYLLGVLCLAAMALAPVVTVAMLPSPGIAGPSNSTPLAAVLSGAVAPADGATAAALPWNPQTIVVAAWLVGVLALSLRLAGGWIVTRRFIARTRDRASSEIRWLARRIGDRLAVSRDFEILISPAITVPMLVGWMAPVVILPTAALSGLAPAQVEALIAHELAHVRRHDYLVNLLQSALETLLFFHPAVWWVSRDVREAREHCCDDLVVGLCDRVVYASALADLAAIVRGPSLALAATDGSLVSRVRRILNGGDESRAGRPGWMPAAVLATLVVAAAPIALATAHGTFAQGSAPDPVSTTTPPGFLPGERSVTLATLKAPEAPAGLEVAAPAPSGPQDVDIRELEAKLQRELDALGRQGDVSRVLQDRRDELEAAIERLRAMAVDRSVAGAQLEQRQIDLQALEAKLKALDDQFAARKRPLDEGGLAEAKAKLERLADEQQQRDVDKVAEVKAKLQRLSDARDDADLAKLAEAQAQFEKIKPMELDEMAAKKLKEARFKEVEETLAKREAAARTAGEDDVADQIARMKAEMDRQDAMVSKLSSRNLDDMKIEMSRTGDPLLLVRADGRDATDFDPREMQSVIGPALDAGPNDVSVVGNAVKHPGHVAWRDGLTVEAALKAAGAPPTSDAGTVVRRLSELRVTFGAGGPHVNGRVDEVGAGTLLRPGDVLVISPRVRK